MVVGVGESETQNWRSYTRGCYGLTMITEALITIALTFQPSPSGDGGGSDWDRLAECESGGNWSANTGNGYSGGLQFTDATWQAMGGSTESAWAASKAEQIAVAERLYAEVGWSAWPGCAAQLGLSGAPSGGGGGGGGEAPEPEPEPEPEPAAEQPAAEAPSDEVQQQIDEQIASGQLPPGL
jgi:resuscitation-promoting factor RpfA